MVVGAENIVLIGGVLEGLHEADFAAGGVAEADRCGVDLHLFYMKAEVVCGLEAVDEDRHTA